MFYKNSYDDDLLISRIIISRATLKEAEEYKNVLNEEILHKRKKIIIDLSGCEYIDSTFIGAIVYSLKSVLKIGGDLKLVNLKSDQNAIFQWTKLNRVFEIYTSVNEARSAFYNEFKLAV